MKNNMIEGPFFSYSSAQSAAGEIKKDVYRNSLQNIDPKIMLVLGSGCGDVADNIETVAEIPYKNIPYMQEPTVDGHKGVLKIGKYHGKDVLGFQGRNHYYEGHSAHDASFMIYLAKHLGAEVAIMTSAGGIAPKYNSKLSDKERYPAKPGDLFLVEDVDPNLLPSSLRGPILKEIGARFKGTMNMSSIYLGLMAKEIAKYQKMELGSCIYVPRQGPNYETPLEVTLLSHMSAIAGMPVVGGMSLVPELEAANMLGMESVAIAVVTNQMFDLEAREKIKSDAEFELVIVVDEEDRAIHTLKEGCKIVGKGIQQNQPHHEEVTATAGSKNVTEKLEKLIGGLVKALRF
ncbi:MAG: purine-nucleoside phosphorylase [Nanoarchaeota archaeon]|nr:purine-nucleoside phosphorylase [Nanoarchaeota archaeon]